MIVLHMADTLSYTLRIPKILLSRLDAYADNHDMTRAQLVIEACRAYLDDDSGSLEMYGKPLTVNDVNSADFGVVVNRSPGAVPDIQALRDICAGKVAVTDHEPQAEIPMCMKTWWEDGEQYECLMDKGHKELKHGQRGMVRKIDQ